MRQEYVLFEIAGRRAEITVCPDTLEIFTFDWDEFDGADEERKAAMLAEVPEPLRHHIIDQL
jgi:hypothetical protein